MAVGAAVTRVDADGVDPYDAVGAELDRWAAAHPDDVRLMAYGLLRLRERPGQWALEGAIAALTDWADWPSQLCRTYRERRDRVTAALCAGGWPVSPAEMALYLWMPLPAGAAALGWDDERCSAELLSRSGVALTPGSGFGEAGQRWLRMALVQPASELEQAVARLLRATDALV